MVGYATTRPSDSQEGGSEDNFRLADDPAGYFVRCGFLLWLHAVNGMRHNHAAVSGRSIHFYEEIDWPDDSDK